MSNLASGPLIFDVPDLHQLCYCWVTRDDTHTAPSTPPSTASASGEIICRISFSITCPKMNKKKENIQIECRFALFMQHWYITHVNYEDYFCWPIESMVNVWRCYTSFFFYFFQIFTNSFYFYVKGVTYHLYNWNKKQIMQKYIFHKMHLNFLVYVWMCNL